ncbi:MAG: ABC transporter permease, partial [Gemmatimonadales bacterium]
MHDVRLALRQIRKRPGFIATAVLTLGLGLGATTALFTVVESVVLSPLPYEAPEELLRLDSPVPTLAPDAVWGLSESAYFYFRAENRTLAEIGAFSTWQPTLLRATASPTVQGAAVTPSLFRVLGARAALGRLFTEDEAAPGGPAVVVLSHATWRQDFGGDSSVIGRTTDLSTTPYEIVGVMAADLHLPDRRVDVWAPLRLDRTR